MVHYVRIVLNLIFVLFSLGFIGPFFVSAASDFAVAGGILYLVLVVPAVLYYINRSYVKTIVEKIKS